MQSSDAADESVDITQIVRLVGQIKNSFLLRQAAPVEVQSFERPVWIVRAEQDELGLGQSVAVTVGVDHRHELAACGRIHALGKMNLLVVLDLLRQPTECPALQLELCAHVEHVDDHRGNTGDARIDGCRQPGCPATLGCAGDCESLDPELPQLLR